MARHDTRLELRLPADLGEAAREKAEQDHVQLSTVIRGLLVLWVRGDVLQTSFNGVTRRCTNCLQLITRIDERVGKCPHCGAVLVSLAH